MSNPVEATRRMLLRSLAVMIPTAAAAEASSRTTVTTVARVVYHIDDVERAVPAFRNANNHLKAAPGTKIVVVALGHGIDFLLKDAKYDRGNPYEPMIDDLVMAGVEFRICNNTLIARGADKSSVHPEARVVESGVAEITRLQFFENYAYLKP